MAGIAEEEVRQEMSGQERPLEEPLPKVIAIMGTNASGKSLLGINIAEHFCGEVISADSRQVFKGLDLGAGKVSEGERKGIRHHLIDVAELNGEFSLARYQQLAYRAIDETFGRSHLPVVVGGSGLYLTAVCSGYLLVDVPPKKELRARMESLDTDALIQRLAMLDCEAVDKIDIRNRRRVIRAIEVAEAGVPSKDTRCYSPRYSVLKLGLTWRKEVLRDRIRARLLARLRNGMVEEVKYLLMSGANREWLYALGLEYRHILWLLDGRYKSVDELQCGLELAISQFAQRQMRWFRRDRELVWLNSEGDYLSEAVARVSAFLAG